MADSTVIEKTALSPYQQLKAENEQLKGIEASLKQDNNRLKNIERDLKNDKTILNAENERLKNRETILKGENERLKNSEANLKGENERLKNSEANLKAENERLKNSEANLNAENERLKNNQANLNTEKETLLLQRYNELANAVKTDTENANAVISYLKELNDYLTKKSNRLINEIKPLFAENEQMKCEINALKVENTTFKQQEEKKNKKMYVFMIMVSVLAVFANLTHIGEKYLSLVHEPTLAETLVCYVSMLVFDLCVFLFTIKGHHESAKYFAIGTFLIVFLQLGKPFEHFGMSAIYAEKILLGLIYSGIFAFIPYKLSELFTSKK